jgi:hypothetical protein
MLTGEVGFSIQHPDLSSALSPPDGALVAEFYSASYNLVLSQTRTSSTATSKGRQKSGSSRKRESPAKPAKACHKSRKKNRKRKTDRQRRNSKLETDDIYHRLETPDQEAIDDFISRLVSYSAQQQHSEAIQAADIILLPSNTTRLMYAALETIALGNHRDLKAFKVEEGSFPPGLIRLAPAVFNMPYLKVRRMEAAFNLC